MSRIKNHNDFFEFVESQNYKLLSPYIKSNIKVSLQCPENHIFEMKPANFKFGQRCPECFRLNRGLIHRLTYEQVKKFIEDTGYKLLSDTYETAHKKLLVRCPEGHEYEVQYANFYSGKRCPKCNKINYSILYANSYDYIKEYFKKFNYELISKSYKNNKELLTVKCEEGHLWNVRFDNFYSGQRCPTCQNIGRFSYEYVKSFIENFNYKLLSTEYKNSTYDLLSVECDKGHQYLVTFGNFKDGHRCYQCHKYECRGEKVPTWKGGITSLNNHLRGLLYNNWTIECLKYNNYKCALTGNHSSLVVHHLINFHKIVNMVMSELKLPILNNISQYSYQQICDIDDLFLQYHNLKIGICLLPSIHKFYHKLYGNDNTPEQFEEFKVRLRLGEFDHFLKEHNLKLVI